MIYPMKNVRLLKTKHFFGFFGRGDGSFTEIAEWNRIEFFDES